MIITLLTDLGVRDASVMAAKAILMAFDPDCKVMDISHQVERFDLQQAAYILLTAYKYFPKETIHIVPMDVFLGHSPRIIVTRAQGYYFIAPDNGVLPLALGDEVTDTRLCFECTKPYIFNEWMQGAGRIIESIRTKQDLNEFQPCEIKKVPRIMQPKPVYDGVECNIMYIDRYENVVLDIKKAQFDHIVQDRPFKIKISREAFISSISHNYNDVNRGEPLCRFNSAGYLEIALNHDKAATRLGLGAFNTGNLSYQTIKITVTRS